MSVCDDGSGTVLAALPRVLLAFLSSRGIDTSRLCREAGLASMSLDDEDERVARSAVDTLWRLGVAASGDPALGVRLAEVLPPGNAGVVELVAQSSATAREALAHTARYWHLLNDGVDVRVEARGPRVALTLREKRPPPLAPAWLDLTAAALVAAGTRMTAGGGRPLEVQMPGSPGPAAPELERLLEVPVRWGAPSFAVVFDAAHLDQPLLAAAPALHGVLRAHAEQSLGKLATRGPGLLAQVREAIVARLEHGDATLARIARALGTSPRSLQRAIGRHGSSLRTLVDEARRDIALRELGAGRRSVTDLAFLLGFSEVSAFDRAFRRWTGRSPVQFRAAHRRG